MEVSHLPVKTKPFILASAASVLTSRVARLRQASHGWQHSLGHNSSPSFSMVVGSLKEAAPVIKEF